MGLEALGAFALFRLFLHARRGLGGQTRGFAGLGLALQARFLLEASLFFARRAFGGDLRPLGLDLGAARGDFGHLGAGFFEHRLTRFLRVALTV